MDNPNKNWFKVNRCLDKHWVWNTGEPFTKGQAWIDLLMLAYYEDRKTMANGKVTTIKRGQIPYSMLFFADRWKWSRGKVKRFFDVLEMDGMCSINSTTHGTTITIENYSKWQGGETTDDTTDGQRTVQRTDIVKNIKNIKNIKRVFTPPSVEDVRAYCSDRGNDIDPETFVDFYQSRGWLIGKNKMKDWKAAVRTWEKRQKPKTDKYKDNWTDKIGGSNDI